MFWVGELFSSVDVKKTFKSKLTNSKRSRPTTAFLKRKKSESKTKLVNLDLKGGKFEEIEFGTNSSIPIKTLRLNNIKNS